MTAKGHRCVNSNETAYYIGYESALGLAEMYIDIAAGVPSSQRTLLLGGEVSVWTDHYTAPELGMQCGVDKGPQTNPAKALFPRSQDAAFAKSTLAVTFPATVVAADSWWRYEKNLDVNGDQYQARLVAINARMSAAGVDGCPSSCMMKVPSQGGCSETHRCGVPYVPGDSDI